mmetsp:Transcript_9114/g.16706  ORF Transcript_9114/g.16706 Transcript_9114/m.16706 type:complete len:350 (-) Transcript_9114:568-1617(-)
MLLLIQVRLLSQGQVDGPALSLILHLEERTAGQAPLGQTPLRMQSFLFSLLSRLGILRIENARAVHVDRRPVGAELALETDLGECRDLAIGEAFHSHASCPRPTNEAVRVWLHELARLQNLLPRWLWISHPHSPCPPLSQRLLLQPAPEHMQELHDLESCHDGVGAGDSRYDGSRDGLRVPARESGDTVVLHPEVGSAVDEVHGNGIILAERTLAEHVPPLTVHLGDAGHEALGISRHGRHPLGFQLVLVRRIPRGLGLRQSVGIAQGPRWGPAIGPQVLQLRLLLDVLLKEVREDALTHIFAIHFLLILELAHLGCQVRQQVRLVFGAEAEVKEILCPCQAVHRLFRR